MLGQRPFQIPSSIFASSAPRSSNTVVLDILPVKLGGPALHYAAYLPSTTLNDPAHATIPVIIRNFDLDAAPVPAGPAPPYPRVAEVDDGVATTDGFPYSVIDGTNLAHTFIIPALHINVPIPAHASASASRTYLTIMFRFRTGAAGTLLWKCSDPCSEDPDGETGAMADDTYMRGTLMVRP